MLNHAVTASDRVWPSRPNYSRENKRGLRSGCVSGCAGMEVLLPLHTHTPCREDVSGGKEFISGCSRVQNQKSLGDFPHRGTSQLLSRHCFPPLQLELSHKKSLAPQGDKSTTRGSQPKTRPSDELLVQMAINPSYPRDVSLPHHGGALGTTCPKFPTLLRAAPPEGRRSPGLQQPRPKAVLILLLLPFGTGM